MKKPINSEFLVFHYGKLMESFARLANFNGFIDRGYESEITKYEESLFYEDITSFAIYLRKIIEATNHIKKAKNRKIPAKKEINLYQIISRIIHSRDLIIVRSEVHSKMLKSSKKFDAWELYSMHLEEMKNPKPFEPELILETTSDGWIVFKLKDLLEAADELVVAAVDTAERNDVDLERF